MTSSRWKRIAWAAAVLPVLASAGEPTVDVQALATTQAILDFCARANPKAAEQYAQQSQALLQGISTQAADELRRSDAYQQSYDAIAQMISDVPEKEARRVCSEAAARKP